MAEHAVKPGEDPRHPRLTETLIGHGAAEDLLLSAHSGGRLPHAWLITGPRGVGKATLAYRFARFLLETGDPADGDGLFGAPPPALTTPRLVPLSTAEAEKLFLERFRKLSI